MKFSTLQLIIGSQLPTQNDLKMIVTKAPPIYEYIEDLYEFELRLDERLHSSGFMGNMITKNYIMIRYLMNQARKRKRIYAQKRKLN